MIFPSEDRPTGTLRLSLTGTWSVREFDALLRGVMGTYDLIEQLQLLCEASEQEVNSNSREYIWQSLFALNYPFHPNFEEALRAVSPYTRSLTIGAIRLQSPGWVEVIGSMNPLKVVADFITSYRAENTKRMAIQSNESIEKDKIRAKLATDILKMMPEGTRHNGIHRVVDVTRAVIQPSLEFLEPIAADERVERARLSRGSSDLGDLE